MDGFQHLPSQQQQRFWVYTGDGVSRGAGLGSTYQTWIKPPGISFVHITAIGAAGGGSGAYIYQAGVAARGGSGGGSGAMTSVFLPAYLVPDILYISVAVGGNGGAASTSTSANAGSNGIGATYVAFYPVDSAGYALCIANAGNAGTAPAGGAGAVGGTAGANVSSTALPTSQIGLRNYLSGQAGGTGLSNVTTDITAIYRITGGGSGGGNSAGGAVASGSSILISGGDTSIKTIASSPAGTDGIKFEDLIQFIAAGGPGASTLTTITGSGGGGGGFGSGGGGGSVGLGRGGAGGKGGNGLVIITCG
jgi:hypothetical protein